MKSFFFTTSIIVIFSITSLSQQNVAINDDGSAPDPKAILDVKSSTKGLLLPRMTTAQRQAIGNAPEGLMIYDTDAKSIFFSDPAGGGNTWNNVMSSDLVLPYFEGVSLNNAAFHIQNAQPSATAIAGKFSAGDGIGVNGEGNIGGKFFGATTGIDVVGGGNGGYAGNFFSANGRGVHIDVNGTGESLIVERGNTGLGILTPQAKLHVSADATNGENIFLSSALFYNPVDEMKLAHWTQQSVGGAPLDSYFGMRSNHRLNIVSNNNISNPELSLFDGKVGVNKIDGTYPLSINGKTGIYEDNVFVGELFGKTDGHLYLNSNTSNNRPSRKHLIIQTSETPNTYAGFVGINNISPQAFLDVQKLSDNYETAAILGTSIFSEGNSNVTRIEGGTTSGLGVLSLNSDIKANVSIADGGGNVFIAPKSDHCGDVFIGSGFQNYQNADSGTNGGNVFIAQSGGDVIMKHLNTSLSIGTDKKDHRLNVNGTIRSTELIVESGWADYVFEDTYHLKPLVEVEQYIIQNNRLPEIPSAEDIQTNGLKVSEIQTKMMAKIEELTLYLIDQNKKIEVMAKEIEILKNNQK